MEECNLLIVSDLHLGEGFDPKSGRFSRHEDFLFDDAFARFLRYHETVKGQPRFGSRPWLLIFNGDLFDFLQVISLPERGRSLRTVKGLERHGDLRSNEREYGLGTTAAESEWKLMRIARGHQRLFAALGWFVAHGNHVVVIKGNHDIELHWPEVQERLVTEVRRAYTRERLMLGHRPPITQEEVSARFRFYPWFYCEPGRIYVEHGGQYDSANYYPDYLNPVMPGHPERIQLPWGSLFVRYIFNKVEDVHPFADNVKPPVRYFAWALRKDPLMTIKLLVTRSWIFLRAFWNMAHKTVEGVLQRSRGREQASGVGPVPLPPQLAERIAALARRWASASWQEFRDTGIRAVPPLLTALLVTSAALTILARAWWGLAVCLIGAVFAYLLRRFVSRRFSHSFDDLLLRVARDLEQTLKPDHTVPCIVLGHDHRAVLERLEQTWYVNTGAWVQIYERKGPIEGREKLTFLRLAWAYEGAPELLRWDDAAGEPTRLTLGLE